MDNPSDSVLDQPGAEAQKREADALSAQPDMSSSVLQRLKTFETNGDLAPGMAERILSIVQQGREDLERKADIEARQNEAEHLQKVTTHRRIAGYVLLGMAGVAIPVVFFCSTHHIHKLTELPKEFPADRFWLLVGGQAAVTFFTVYFLYQVLKAAERMAMPYWWAERYPHVVRLMLGFEDILTTSSKSAEQAARVIAPLAEPLMKFVDVATKLLDALKDKVKSR